MTRIADDVFRLILIALLLLFAIKGIILGSWGLAIIELVLAGFLAFAFWWDHRESRRSDAFRRRFSSSREAINKLKKRFPSQWMIALTSRFLALTWPGSKTPVSWWVIFSAQIHVCGKRCVSLTPAWKKNYANVLMTGWATPGFSTRDDSPPFSCTARLVGIAR